MLDRPHIPAFAPWPGRPGRTPTAADRRRAYTLIELLTVLVIAATLAAAAMPALAATLESFQVDGLARQIATDLRYAQMLAVKEGVRHRVSFWTAGQAYAVRRWDGGTWALRQHPVTKTPWRLEIDQHSPYAGLALKEASFGSDGEYLLWDTYGSPDNGGYVRFTLGSTTRTIHVAPLSGKISVD